MIAGPRIIVVTVHALDDMFGRQRAIGRDKYIAVIGLLVCFPKDRPPDLHGNIVGVLHNAKSAAVPESQIDKEERAIDALLDGDDSLFDKLEY